MTQNLLDAELMENTESVRNNTEKSVSSVLVMPQ
jgi:hypothetical protein